MHSSVYKWKLTYTWISILKRLSISKKLDYFLKKKKNQKFFSKDKF